MFRAGFVRFRILISLLIVVSLTINTVDVAARQVSEVEIGRTSNSFEDKIEDTSGGSSGVLELVSVEDNTYEVDEGEWKTVTKSVSVTDNSAGSSWAKYKYIGGSWVLQDSGSTSNNTKSYNQDGYTGTLSKTSSWKVSETDNKPSNPEEGDTYRYDRVYGATYSGTVSKQVWDSDWNQYGTYDATYSGTTITQEEAMAQYGNESYQIEMVGDPVNIVTGNFFTNDTDMVVLDYGSPIEIERSYNAQNDSVGILGKGWTFKFSYSIVEDVHSGNTTITYGDGHSIVFTYDSLNGEYNAPLAVYDRLIKESDSTFTLIRKNKEEYKFDSNGKLSTIEDIYGNQITFTYDINLYIDTITSASGRVLDFTIVDNKIDTISDEFGNSVTYKYSGDNLTHVTNHEGTKIYTYNTYGIETITDKNGNLFLTNEYDQFGRVLHQIDGEGLEMSFVYSESMLTNSLITDNNGSEISYTYNMDSQIVKVTYYDGTYEEFGYDIYGNKNSVRDRKGNVTNLLYDARGNLLKITASAPYNYVTDFVYNSDDNLEQIQFADGGLTDYRYYPNGSLHEVETKISDTESSITAITYDTVGRVETLTDPVGNITTYEYDPGDILPTKIIDAELNTVSYTYNDLNQVKTITTTNGTTELFYNNKDQLEKTVDALGNVSLVKVDALGNITKLVSPEQYDAQTGDGIGTVLEYDKMDRLIKQTDPIGNILSYQYDAMGNLTKTVNPNYYDEISNDGDGIQFEYDKEDRLIRTIDPYGATSRIKYDANGNVTEVIDPNNYIVATDDGYGYQYQYDELNRVSKVIDPNGVVVSEYVYDSMGRVVKYIDAEGYLSGATQSERFGTFYEYNLAGWLTRVSVPKKVIGSAVMYDITSYEYYDNGQLKNEIISNEYSILSQDPVKTTTITYTYDGNGRLDTVSDTTGSFMDYDYDSVGNLVSSTTRMTDTQNRVQGYDYDELGRLTDIWLEVDSSDLEGDYSGIVNSNTHYTYDGNGNIKTITTPDGYTTTFHYDDAGLLRTMEQEVSESWMNATHVKASIESLMFRAYEGQSYSYEVKIDTDEEISAFSLELEYDTRTFNFVDSVITATNVTVDSSVLGKLTIVGTNQTLNGENTLGTLNFDVTPDQLGTGYIVFSDSTNYQDAGLVTKSFTELTGQSASVEAPDMNNDGVVLANDVTLAALNHSMTPNDLAFEYKHDIDGNGVVDTPDLDYITEWIFNDRDQSVQQLENIAFTQKLVQPRYESGLTIVIKTTTYDYDAAGNLITVTEHDGQSTSYDYDKNNRLIRIIDNQSNTLRYFYDASGNVEKIVSPENYNSSTDNGVGTVYTYDKLGRVDTITNAEGVVVTKYVYDERGFVEKTIDGAGYLSGTTNDTRYGTEYTYDIGGRLTSVTTPESKDNGLPSVSYTYDASNNILTVTDGENNTTTYIRDHWGRATEIINAKGISEYYDYDYVGNVISAIDGEGNQTLYDYNQFNQLRTITDPKFNVITYKYDIEGRLASELDRNGEKHLYSYNNYHQLTSRTVTDDSSSLEEFFYNRDGEMFAAVNKNGIEEFTFDSLGRVEQQLYNDELKVTYGYNSDSQVSSLELHNGNTVNYDYDIVGRINTVADNDSILATYDYTSNGNIDSITYETGAIIDYGYNKDGYVDSLSHSTSDGSYSKNFTYDYYNNGNLKSVNEDGAITGYVYDAISQLVEVSYPTAGVETYTYDDAGNRLTKSNSTSSSSYVYNNMNQLIQSTTDGILTSYNYDANGNMLWEKSENEYTNYSYNNYNQLEMVSNPDGSWHKNIYAATGMRNAVVENGIYTGFVSDGWSVIAEENVHGGVDNSIVRGYDIISNKDSIGRDHYYFNNLHGDIVSILDSSNRVLNQYEYDAYGIITSSKELLPNRYTYTGEQLDSVSADYYLRARYYNPVIGRFTQEDVYRGDGLNLYSYVHNNPIMYVDSSGHFAWIAAGAVIGGLIGGVSQVVTNVATGNDWNDGLLGAVAGGAVAGGITAATGGASLIAASFAGAAVTSTINEVEEYVKGEEELTVENVGISILEVSVTTAVTGSLNLMANGIAGDIIKINPGWIKPTKTLTEYTIPKLVKSFSGNYTKNLMLQSGVSGGINTFGSSTILEAIMGENDDKSNKNNTHEPIPVNGGYYYDTVTGSNDEKDEKKQ